MNLAYQVGTSAGPSGLPLKVDLLTRAASRSLIMSVGSISPHHHGFHRTRFSVRELSIIPIMLSSLEANCG